MRARGRLYPPKKKGNVWYAEIGLLSISADGVSAKDACARAVRALESLVCVEGFRAQYTLIDRNEFTVHSEARADFLAFILRRTRESYGLSLRDMAQRLNVSSPNTYARYEQGKHAPTVEKFEELLRAIDPELEPVLGVNVSRIFERMNETRK